MGNTMIAPCFSSSSSSSVIKLIFYEGTTTILTPNKKHIAGEIMFQNPDKLVCHADSFFIGRPLPLLSIDDELIPGQTYLILPIDQFACVDVLSASSLASFNSSPNTPINFGPCPFEYIKGSDGRVLIKVVPEFLIRVLSRGNQGNGGGDESNNSFLCSTPELKKHYEQLVGCKQQTWSPKLETISEYKIRYSPCRLLGLEWKQKEKEGS